MVFQRYQVHDKKHCGWGNFNMTNKTRHMSHNIATLALGLRPRQRGYKVAGQEEAWKLSQRGCKRVWAMRKLESHITYSRECKKVWRSVREWTLTLPRQLPLWEMESRWILKTLESDFRGQNSMACGVLYIIEKLLKSRCLKWARITHLDI
jgi:hypothetical protein